MIYGLREYEQLEFLSQYNFKVQNCSNSRYIEICLISDNCCITYHDWPQFGDFNIIITKNLEDRKTHRFQAIYGYHWLLENVLPKYNQCENDPNYSKIELFSFYMRDQLKNHRNVFDISMDVK